LCSFQRSSFFSRLFLQISSRQFEAVSYCARIELYAAFHGSVVGWLLRIVVMEQCTHRNILVWLCCSRLASHTYEIVTECCGSLDTSSRPDQRKVTTVTGDVQRWLNRLLERFENTSLAELFEPLLMDLSSLFLVTLRHFYYLMLVVFQWLV